MDKQNDAIRRCSIAQGRAGGHYSAHRFCVVCRQWRVPWNAPERSDHAEQPFAIIGI